MAGSAIVLFGQLSLNNTDVSDDVTSFTISGARNEVAVGATLGNKVSYVKPGSESWEIEISFRQSEGLTSAHKILYNAMLTDDATVTFSGSLEDDINSDNFYGTMTVTSWDTGGAADSLAESSHTYKLTARPVRTVGGS